MKSSFPCGAFLLICTMAFPMQANAANVLDYPKGQTPDSTLQEAIVVATRAEESTPIAFTNLDKDAIDYKKKLIATLEEHNIIGGLGSVVADVLSQYSSHPKLLKLGINDRFVPVGSYKYLLQKCGLDIEGVKKMIINNLK